MLDKAARLGIGQRLRYALTMPRLIANARMYAVTPGRRGAAGSALFALGRRASRRPARLSSITPRRRRSTTLWSRARSRPRLHVRLPVRARATGRAGGRRAAAGAAALRRTRRLLRPISSCAPTARSAQLGRHVRRPHRLDGRALAIGLQRGQAPPAAPSRRPEGAALFRQAVGPLVTPRRVTEACWRAKSTSVRSIPIIMSFCRRFEPQTAARLRTVEIDRADADAAPRRFRGGRRPIGRPASPNARRLRDGCRHGRRARGARGSRALQAPRPDAYRVLLDQAAEAEAQGYPAPG